MKGKRLIVTLVFVFALMLALAISSYAATITLYSGADATSSATTHNGSLTLTGNTEENETVTVYFTDDGRAWKAGETVSFTEDTNLYTIECTKISSASEYQNAAGGGNYIITADITDKISSGLNGNSVTTRIFLNGKKISLGDGYLINGTGNSHSFYLLGAGTISSIWGRGIYLGHCSNANTDVTWFIGKDVTFECNKDSNELITIYGAITSKSLQIHIYGKIITGTGNWALISTDKPGNAYDIYFHEGSESTFRGSLFEYRQDHSIDETTSIYVDGGSLTLSTEGSISSAPDINPYKGTVKVTAGVISATNTETLALFKNAIDEDKMALDIDSTSFRVICKECAFEKTLGDDFVGLTSDFTINSYCPNCKTTGESTAVSKVFEAKGYSLNPDSTAINGGYIVNHTSLALYEEIMGNISYGIVIANANSFGNNSFFDESNAVNSESAIQVPIENKYSFFNFTIAGFGASTSTLELIITAYAINEDGTVTYIQSVNDYALEVTIGTETFTKVTLDSIKANASTSSTDAIVPSNDEE